MHFRSTLKGNFAPTSDQNRPQNRTFFRSLLESLLESLLAPTTPPCPPKSGPCVFARAPVPLHTSPCLSFGNKCNSNQPSACFPSSIKNRCQDAFHLGPHFLIDFWSTVAPNLDPLERKKLYFHSGKARFFDKSPFKV